VDSFEDNIAASSGSAVVLSEMDNSKRVGCNGAGSQKPNIADPYVVRATKKLWYS
jgi:hypothetical protein